MHINEIYRTLLAHYGHQNWWPAETPYEVIAGAILTQNTNWRNVERAIANFGGDLTPQRVLSLTTAELVDYIRPAGFFNQKAVYLQAVTRWYERYGFDVETVRAVPLEILRAELLSVRGVGRETADSILLYAFGLPSFVVDAYTIRLLARFNIDAGKNYDAVKAFFERELPCDPALYNEFHALIVDHGKERCHKKPSCVACPLIDSCVYDEA